LIAAKKYSDWLSRALKQVSDDFCNGSFNPENESDVKCHLYESFLRTKKGIKGLNQNHRVLSEFKVLDSQKRIDLAIVKRSKGAIEPRLLIEIKEIGRDHLPPDEIRRRVQPDVDKLLAYKMDKGNRVVLFFFRGAGSHGIGVRTNNSLQQLRQEYKDVILEWGPR